ncbi:DUF6691 family protein [Pseudomonas sp. W2I6]
MFSGICPGPAIALLFTGCWQILIFVVAMLAGMHVFSSLEGRRTS